ncbi:MAG: L,D-transpeptidase family protein [Alphaproteobacteria bacterium]|nr:L,D-transpeptidase family protein [Alphaproteobacteria bacterium]
MKFFVSLSLLLAFLLSPLAVQARDDAPYIGDQLEYRSKYEDTFVHLARDYKLGFVEMRAANPDVDPWLPGEGTTLTLPTRHIFPDAPHDGIVINLPEMRLYAFLEGKEPVTFPLGVGREGLETPTGTTKIVRKKEGPIWTPTPRMREDDPLLKESYGPGPDNPMGTHAMYLGWPQYAIHGTNRPFGIGRRVSSGCIRMYPEDIEVFFEMVPVGTKVTVVDQPIKLAWIEDKLFIEAHPNLEQAFEMEETAQISSSKLSDDDMERIIAAAGEYGDRIRWSAVRTAVRERKGIPVYIARRPGTEDLSAAEGEEEIDFELEQAELEKIKEEARGVLQDVYEGGDSMSEEVNGEAGVSEEQDDVQNAAFESEPHPMEDITLNP